MKIKKSSLIINKALILIVALVFSVSFIPGKITPIYGGESLSAYYNGNRSKPQVSLMFNVYESAETVEKIVDTLNSYGAKATFFIGGCWADDNGKTLNKIAESGHEIANHGYFHKDHKKLDYAQNKEEINLTGIVIEALCGVRPTLFAPPSGSYSTVTLTVADELNYKVVMWSKDTIDWRDANEKLVYERATNSLTNGDLILMHPKEHTLKALPNILEYIAKANLRAVTVSENLAE